MPPPAANSAYYEYGYIGTAPGYYEDEPNETPPPIEYSGSVYIEVDNEGNISVYPYDKAADKLFTGDYLKITFPINIATDNFNFALPYGWTYEIGHGTTNPVAYSYFDEITGEEIIRDTEAHPYTRVSIRHTWNDDDGFMGIMPLAVNLPPGFVSLPYMQNITTLPGLITAITSTPGVNNNRVVAISGNITQTAAIAVPAGRHVVLVS